MITGSKVKGGLFSPTALRVIAVCMFMIPIVGLFTGYYREKGLVAIWQAAMYFLGGLGLRQLARKRESAVSQSQAPGQS